VQKRTAEHDCIQARNPADNSGKTHFSVRVATVIVRADQRRRLSRDGFACSRGLGLPGRDRLSAVFLWVVFFSGFFLVGANAQVIGMDVVPGTVLKIHNAAVVHVDGNNPTDDALESA
jgi:hypothetical protein